MSRIQDHLDQWKHNRDFLQTIGPSYPDWIITSAFYLALHAVEAVLTADKATSPNTRHQQRFLILQSQPRYRQIYISYRVLYDVAHVTRYSAKPNLWLPAKDINQKIIRDRVYPIEKSVRNLLAGCNPPVAAPAHSPIALLEPTVPVAIRQ